MDGYGDWDLRQLADYRSWQTHAPGPPNVADLAWLTENRCLPGSLVEIEPSFVSWLEASGQWLGGSEAALRRVRDLRHLAAWAAAVGLAVPDVLDVGDPGSLPLSDGSWLIKPHRSFGGVGVVPYVGQAIPEGHYLQRRRAGLACSASFLATATTTRLLGCARQLIGPAYGAPGPFAYAGAVGPLFLPAPVTATFHQLGETLARDAGLRGLFGLDFIWDGRAAAILEVNPRYTASMEVLERASGRSFVAELLASAEAEANPVPSLAAKQCRGLASGSALVGSLVVYAPFRSRLPPSAEFYRRWQADPAPPWDRPWADLPNPGTEFQAGEPVLTVFARAANLKFLPSRLFARRLAVLRELVLVPGPATPHNKEQLDSPRAEPAD